MNQLAPEHLNDLRRSGLSDATIALLQFEAIRPQKIKIQGVTSAYSIPYFALDGSVNCFTRRRLFPPVTRPDGSTQKYFQPPGSPPQLYMPPLFPWTTVANDQKCELLITEGEKKAAAACERGRFCLGVGGVWNWRQTLDTGERLVIPTLDQFIWPSRKVELIPDSDVWRKEKRHALFGFYALGQELISRGATVRLLKVPEDGGGKVGLDDWLVQVGDTWENLWPQLERLSLDDERLASVAAWWQSWREKQTTQNAIKAHDADDIEVTETAGLYTVHSPKHAVRMMFDRLSDVHGGVSAEMTVRLGATELLSGVDLGLKSDTGQTKLARSLNTLAETIPWKLLLQKGCALVLKRHRMGVPPTRLNRDSTVEPLAHSVDPFVFKKKTTILFGDGGLGKSTLALFCAMCVSAGSTVADIGALKGRALYLDYEDDADVHTRRLHAIMCGHPDLARADVLYQRCIEPLTKITYPLVRRIQEEGISFVVLDSLIASTGGDASAEGTAKLFAALRLLECDVLALGHVPKTQPEGADHSTVYGSVFNQNFARMLWEVQKEPTIGEDVSILRLLNRKSNLSRLHHPIGLKVTQNVDSTRIYYEPYDLSQVAKPAQTLSAPARIRSLLEDGAPRSAKEIAVESGIKLETVQSTLSKHKGIKWRMLGGVGQKTKWTV